MSRLLGSGSAWLWTAGFNRLPAQRPGRQITNQDHRASDDYLIRILAMSGLNWNAKLRSKNRDFAQIALAAVLESVIVPTYRQDLTDPLVCLPVAALRGQLGHIFLDIIKPSCGMETWFFADWIDYPIEDPENLPRVYDPEELQEELNKSILVAKVRKNNRIKKSVGVLLKNRYLRLGLKTVP
jgi:hypothetical protein